MTEKGTGAAWASTATAAPVVRSDAVPSSPFPDEQSHEGAREPMVEVDLHLHTTFSDGTLTPTELVTLCAERGLKVISISDHDSTEGMAEALETASNFPEMTVIPGIELSTEVPGSEIHVLGYYVDCGEPSFQRMLAEFREGRVDRGRQMVRKLNDLGLRISWERVLELSGGGAVGRPHMAQALVEAGYVRYPREAFERYIGRDGPAYMGRARLAPAEAVKLLIDNGALPVMAHPTYHKSEPGLTETEGLRRTLRDLKDAGLVGLEVHYGSYTEGGGRAPLQAGRRARPRGLRRQRLPRLR